MREGAGVDQDTGEAFLWRRAAPVDELSFVIGLPAVDARAALLGEGLERGVNVTERLLAIDFRLAGAQELQVGSRKHENGDRRHHASCSSSLGAAVRIK